MSKVTINGVEYTPFESGKNAKELGIDLSRKFIVVAAEGGSDYFVDGDIISIDVDDNTTLPYFKNDSKNYVCMIWRELAYYDENVPKSATPLTNTIITSIKDEAQHKRVQEKLFEMGCEWIDTGKNIWKLGFNGDIRIRNSKMDWLPKGKEGITADEFLGKDKIITTDPVNGCDVEVSQIWKKHDDGKLELISTSANGIELLNNTHTDTPKPIVKGNKIMSNIVSFFNDLTVSAEDKDLRKAGLKDDELNWTTSAGEIVLNLEAKERKHKSFSELRKSIGMYNEGAMIKVTELELDALFTKFYPKLLETAKKFNKREENK